MARIIVKARYYKPTGGKKISGYMRYIATRENVEMLDDTKQFMPPTKGQIELIGRLLADFPDRKDLLEYEDYLQNPTIRNASEFIERCAEDSAANNMKAKTYAKYIATRPRAEKICTHGLFTDDDREIKLSAVEEELNNYPGKVFTFIVSLRREDAGRLNYESAEAWRDLVRSHTQELAESLRIPYSDLKWYAAFHNESDHPHIHLMAYSRNPKEGYLTNKGIEKIRSALANDIFSDEFHHLYEEKSDARTTFKSEWKELLSAIMSEVESDNRTHSEIEQKLNVLAGRLRNTKGKKVYGYLKKDVKDLIDSIVDWLANDENIAILYDLWWEKKCEVLRTYYQNIPQEKPPLSQNKEFKLLKNDIIREALKIGGYLAEEQMSDGGKNRTGRKENAHQSGQHSATVHQVSATAVTGLFRSLAATFRDRIQKEDRKIYRVDKRQQREEEQKRNAEIDMTM